MVNLISFFHHFLFHQNNQTPLDNIRLLPAEKWRRIIWQTITYPKSIRFPYGELITGICMSITLLSCIPFMSE
jgi:hypothetical protein